MRTGHGDVAVPDRVGGPVEAGRLAVPPAGDAGDARLGAALHELRAEYRGDDEFLVDPRLVHDAQLGQRRGLPLDLGVQTAEGAARVAGHEPRGVQTGAGIGPPSLQNRAPAPEMPVRCTRSP
ncbi:hypothetical protein PA7_43950 [Pseudonocardia asaccharolytica DSM 44247 = NBRC 16224]|uniref:Uncharacterized protein n=1 Tax=Pseudonocardia asaccharolytica DSM 44247 = NBRC 16224 TaxID=1123024 RepID=A0A511DC77_9PSEU|nr:hypothetical protein PA7_43950 [Pseudonocardia asaccharolytica DSM 44247 = NBRC 16224]